MVAGSIVDECAFSVSAERIWKVSVASDIGVMPKICPEFIAGEEIKGDGGPGTIKTLKFTPAVEGGTVLKSRVLELDGAGHVTKYEVIEGGKLSEQLKSQVIEVKIEAGGASGGCIVKLKVDYETKGGQALSEEQQKLYTQGFFNLFKAVDAYLAANPDAYA